jgi:hypothetical protein
MKHRATTERQTVLIRCADLLVAERPGLVDRLAARWRPRRLDRALAAGTEPEASAALALRATQLTELARRRSIANSLRRIVRESRDGAHGSHGRVIPNAPHVTAAAEELRLLADTLDEPGPVAAPGVAQALILLTDGTGPLYNPRSRISLRSGAARAATQLRAWPA